MQEVEAPPSRRSMAAIKYVQQKRGKFLPLANYENSRHFYACYRKDEFIPRYTRDFIQITARVLEKQRARNSFALD